LAAAPDVNRQKLRENWWAAIKRLATTPTALPWVRRYLKEFPNYQNGIEHLAELQQLHEKALRIANDPAVRARQTGIAFLEHEQLEDAQRELQNSLSKRPKDPQVLGSMACFACARDITKRLRAGFSVRPKLNRVATNGLV
jgi:hypothetical protein